LHEGISGCTQGGRDHRDDCDPRHELLDAARSTELLREEDHYWKVPEVDAIRPTPHRYRRPIAEDSTEEPAGRAGRHSGEKKERHCRHARRTEAVLCEGGCLESPGSSIRRCTKDAETQCQHEDEWRPPRQEAHQPVPTETLSLLNSQVSNESATEEADRERWK